MKLFVRVADIPKHASAVGPDRGLGDLDVDFSPNHLVKWSFYYSNPGTVSCLSGDSGDLSTS